MKNVFFAFMLFALAFIVSCFDDSSKPQASVVIGEKVYTLNLLESAEFYYVTENKDIYAYNAGEIKRVYLTADVHQDSIGDYTEVITPVDMYKLGFMYFFDLNLDGETHYFRQYDGEIIEVDELLRRPDITHKQMNNSRFSITTNTWDVYTVSDIRNLTLGTGICRTNMCQNYYIGSYGSYYSYVLWFCCIDDGLTIRTNGLYFWSETLGSPEKIIDEKGEMW